MTVIAVWSACLISTHEFLFCNIFSLYALAEGKWEISIVELNY